MELTPVGRIELELVRVVITKEIPLYLMKLIPQETEIKTRQICCLRFLLGAGHKKPLFARLTCFVSLARDVILLRRDN